MQLRKFGTTDLDVSSIGFGMWPIGGTLGSGDYGKVDNNEAIAAIKYALDEGINLFDTAPAYGNGFAEEILGKALIGIREKAVITTKCGIYHDYEKKEWVRDSSKSAILRGAEQSLSRLQTDYIDIFLIHWPDDKAAAAESMSAMSELKQSGKVRYIGVSNFSLEEIKTYSEFGLISTQQIGYNLFDRRIEQSMLPFCVQNNIAIMGYGSLCHGLLTGTWDIDFTFEKTDWRSQGDVMGLKLFTPNNLKANIAVANKLKEFAESKNISLPQLAIAWVLSNSNINVALTGMRNSSEVKDNTGVAAVNLSEADIVIIANIMESAQGTIQEHAYDFNNPNRKD